MTEEGMISLNEFKAVVERFESNQKKIVEVMNHRFDRVEADIHDLKDEVGILHEGQTMLKAQFAEMRQEFKEMRREHAEFKTELRCKADAEDVNKLTKRVARLERKSA